MERAARSFPRLARRLGVSLALGGLLALVFPRGVVAGPQAPVRPALPGTLLEGAEAEQFLHTALVIARKPIGSGVTRSERLTLTDGIRTLRAAWKTIDERVMGLSHMDNGTVEFDFRDSWKHDVAAYELDKLLGLGLVPPTVERRIRHRRGALQLWIEDAVNELDRRHRNLRPPDVAAFNARRAVVRFLRELTYDTDYNIQNTIYGPEFRVWAIDFSRAFRISTHLLTPERLHRLPPAPVLEKLRALDRATIEEHLGPWLQGRQIDGLLARRDEILELAAKQQAAAPEAAAEAEEPER
jgi:hypothetical protein